MEQLFRKLPIRFPSGRLQRASGSVRVPKKVWSYQETVRAVLRSHRPRPSFPQAIRDWIALRGLQTFQFCHRETERNDQPEKKALRDFDQKERKEIRRAFL